MPFADAIRRLDIGPIWRTRLHWVDGDAGDTVVTSGCAGSKHPVIDAIAREELQTCNAKPLPLLDDKRLNEGVMGGRMAPLSRSSIGVDVSQGLDWEEMTTAVSLCDRCGLCRGRQQAVFGVGDQNADWLFVGEGPGAEEDLRGEPFVGQAGKLLDAMLASLGLARGEGVYIANAVKCRPPNNRTPELDEIEACFPYLQRQVALIRPRLIVALGRPAAQALLKQEVRIGAARGKLFRFADVPVVVTYHPAYLLRNPADKAKAWEDLCFARKTMREQAPRDAAPPLQ